MPEDNLIRLEKMVGEGRTALIDVTFYDADGVGTVPASGSWTLYNHSDGAVINERSAVAITPDASTYTIELTPADNVMVDETLFVEEHRVYVKYAYGAGGTRSGSAEIQILIENLQKE